MNSTEALSISIALIIVLLRIDSKRRAASSYVLWLPVIWIMINGSRPICLWFDAGTAVVTPESYLEGQSNRQKYPDRHDCSGLSNLGEEKSTLVQGYSRKLVRDPNDLLLWLQYTLVRLSICFDEAMDKGSWKHNYPPYRANGSQPDGSRKRSL